MSETKISVDLNRAGEATIRQGEAEPIQKISPILVIADINAPINYFKHRTGEFREQDAYCQVDYPAKTIVLSINPDKEWDRATITGQLKVNSLLTKTFGINRSERTFSKDEFLKVIKMNRRYFAEETDTFELVSILENLFIKVDKELRDEGDKRGTYNQQIKQTVESDLPESITLHAPIFYDEEPVDIVCELQFEISNNKLVLYLISPDMQEYIQREGEKKILNAIAGFKDKIPIFYV